MEQLILLPTLELYLTGSSKTAQVADNNDFRKDGNFKLRKRKVPAFEQQAPKIDGLEIQRSFLKTQGLGNYAIDCILSKKTNIKRQSGYSATKQRFLD
ncbi:hypothetical protein AYI68_g2309 [Smittium mucronatum]|uniref:Uncharacterized protein n=1 Tax=Smittium mucronatum TaxID=133383 RepID=A0A1R0H335_9FUNG|nr:hypothetical protein AYI68_g2309 [Smittium mucronatum]